MSKVNDNDREDFGKMKAQIENLHEDVGSVKADVKSVLEKLDCLDKKFASKWVEKGIISIVIVLITALIYTIAGKL